MRAELDCLILAAGGARRFGDCKLLADWNGQPLIARIIAAAHALNPERIVMVGGAFYPQLLQALNQFAPEVELLQYRDWQAGMGHSLAFGVSHLQGANAVLVLLGDQPLVSAQDLQNLYGAWSKHPERIACANFANTSGVPAIFPARFKTQLRECTGDRGAKLLFTNYADKLVTLDMPAAEFDVDTPADLHKYLLKNSV